MRVLVTAVFVLAVSLSAVAQIEVGAINSFGTLCNFSEEDLTWSSIECNGNDIFQVLGEPENEANLVGVIRTTSGCPDEGFAIDQQFEKFDFSTWHWMSVNVSAPAEGLNVGFKIWDSENPDDFKIVETTTNKAVEWDTLNFEFAGTKAGVYDRISIHPDFNGSTDGEEWWFDNIRINRPLLTPAQDGTIVDFDEHPALMHYWGEPAEFLIVENIDTTGINKSENCGMIITTNTIGWEGAAVAEKMAPINLEDAYMFKVMVYAPDADLTFMFKLELWEDSGVNVETTAITTTWLEWEELTFDLSGAQSDFYTKIALFPDFLGESDGAEWFFDDVKLVDPENTEVDEDKVIKVFKLASTNYPNPFNPTTTIAYEVPVTSNVNITVYDTNGREIETLVNENHARGTYTVPFDASSLASGVYFYKISTDYDVVTNKMVLIR